MAKSTPSQQSNPRLVAELLIVRREDRDLQWLKQMLQWAIQVEFTTIPPYLCAYWSIKTSGYVATSIYEVVIEEMGHFGLASNLLTTLGGTPVIDSPEVVPTYPGPLPGGVQPSLRIVLRGLKKDKILDSFMQIEYPQHGPITRDLKEFPTIGDFYDAILDGIRAQPDAAFTGARQLRSGLAGVTPITSKAEAVAAIQKIKVQGEGTRADPWDQGVAGDLAHYYRFGQIYHGKQLIPKDGGWKYDGEDVLFPDVYDVPDVPAGGYPASDNFDRLYTTMLGMMQGAWETGNQALLSQAINAMYGLTGSAIELMEMPLPSGSGYYCPDFRHVT